MKNKLVILESDLLTSSITQDEVDYIFVTDFNDLAVTEFYQKFLKLSSNPEIKIIPIVVSSYGGQVHALLSMLDIIKSSSKPVATIGLGKAMSCGSVLLAAGTRGYRYVAPNTDIMVHEVSSLVGGKNSDIQNDAAQTKRLNSKLLKLYGKFSKKPAIYFSKRLKFKSNVDWFISPKEFVKLGLADFVGVPELLKSTVTKESI